MSKFIGGSAFAMSRDIAEGYFLATARTFKNMSPSELNQLAHEMERHLRELRAEPVALDEAPVIQARNRKIQRLRNAQLVLRAAQTQKPR